MADAQTPVLTDEQIEAALQKAGGRWSGDYWVIEDADLHPFVRGVLAAQAPAHPDRAVMQQALDALRLLDEAFCANDYGTREGRDKGRTALIATRAAIAALSASLGQVGEPRNG